MGEEVEKKPAHYRLSRATWDIIVDEYRHGATVPELSEKWRVSQHALRKRITVHGATKRDWGDQIARREARAREEAQAQRQSEYTRKIEALFDVGAEDGKGADETAESLSLVATRASARAMRGQMWDEAKVLAQLAETYGRISTRQERSQKAVEIGLEDIPLDLLKAIALNEGECASARLAIWDEKDPHPAKREYWQIKYKAHSEARDQLLQMQGKMQADEDRIKTLEAELALARANNRT